MGGSGTPFGRRTPDELSKAVERAHKSTDDAAFRQELNALVDGYLRNFNERDPKLARERLDEIKGLIAGKYETTVDSLFGGSVAKHTYVDGLSDIDALIILSDELVGGGSPSAALHNFAQAVRGEVGNGVVVKSGQMAITLEYEDGMELQVLPAIRDGEKIKVPSSTGDTWVGISPRKFTEKLTATNKALSGKLVPTIKLAKAINAELPKPLQLSGYHIESLAIEAFKNDYRGAHRVPDMLRAYYGKATELVRKPIVDSTGQSRHVDDYLGGTESTERLRQSNLMARMERRLANAVDAKSTDQWRSLFGDI